MIKDLQSATWDKWMNSDIDMITLYFVGRSDYGLVGEFDVPENEMHMVLYSKDYDRDILNWFEIVNPQDVAKRKDATLPDVKVRIDGVVYALQEAVKLIVETSGENDD